VTRERIRRLYTVSYRGIRAYLALGGTAMGRACWPAGGVFSLVTSFYGDDEAKFPDKVPG